MHMCIYMYQLSVKPYSKPRERINACSDIYKCFKNNQG